MNISLLATAPRLFSISLLTLIGLFAASAPGPVSAEELVGDPEAGKAASAVCAACHGSDGKALQAEYPNLAGQNAKYIAKQLADYKSDARVNAIMKGMVAALSEQNMADLAAYFAALPAVAGVSNDDESLTLGKNIYRGGITAANVAACIGCHGPTGNGNPAAAYPALSGQNASYVINALNSFRSGQRANDPNSMMRGIAHRLSDTEIAAVANYVQGLH